MNPITYCMNVHPGEDLPAIMKALETVTLPLRDALGEDEVFPLGLRFGSQTAKALRVPETMRSLVCFMQRNHLTTIGINGFPYGPFHGQTVKTRVYEPDWESQHRVSYTRNLFYALTRLPGARLGNDHRLSITTVPLAYDRGQGISETMYQNICAMALFLRKLEGFTGLRMCLALEPEPDCLLQDTHTTVDFFEHLWQHPDWNPAYRELIGLCFDTCHFAVNYEDPLNALRHLVSANVPISRIQISAALEFNQYTTAADLDPFLDSVYLHQTVRREDDASITCFPDLTRDTLPEIIGRRGRIHYHVPLTWDGTGRLGSTRHALTPAFWRYVRSGGWPVEIETYAYFVYPDYLRSRTLSEALLADLNWTREQLRNA